MKLVAGLGISGLLILVVASSTHVDGLFFLAFTLFGLMSVGSSVMTVQTGMIFEGIDRVRVISLLNSLYDAGSITFLGLKYIYDRSDVSFTILMVVYLVVAVVVFAFSLYFWLKCTCSNQGDSHSQTSTGDNTSESDEESGSLQHPKNLLDESLKKDDYIPIQLRPAKDQLQSNLFLSLLLFFAVLLARNQFTLATARDFLGSLGDDDFGNKYLSIFTLLGPVSLIALPFVDVTIERFGYHAGLQTINVLALIHGLIQVMSENLNVQIVGFVVFSFFRCFLFSVSFSFLASFLGPNASGIGSGLMSLAGAIVLAFNFFLAKVAVFNGFFYPNLVYLIVLLPSIFIAVWMRKLARKDKESLNSK